MDSRSGLPLTYPVAEFDKRLVNAAVVGINVVPRTGDASETHACRRRFGDERAMQQTDVPKEMQQPLARFANQRGADRARTAEFGRDGHRALAARRRCRMHRVLAMNECVRQTECIQQID